jgi:hypothetical protein
MAMTRTTFRIGLGAIILSVAAAVGCGGSNDATQFVGTWKITQAMQSLVACADGSGGTFTPAGNVEFALGTTTALVVISPSELDNISPCDFTFAVMGTTAMMTAGQTCNLIGFSQSGVQATFSPSTWSFSLTGPNNAEETGTATMVLPAIDMTTGMLTGQSTNCTYTGHQVALTRVAKD